LFEEPDEDGDRYAYVHHDIMPPASVSRCGAGSTLRYALASACVGTIDCAVRYLLHHEHAYSGYKLGPAMIRAGAVRVAGSTELGTAGASACIITATTVTRHCCSRAGGVAEGRRGRGGTCIRAPRHHAAPPFPAWRVGSTLRCDTPAAWQYPAKPFIHHKYREYSAANQEILGECCENAARVSGKEVGPQMDSCC
jgi:hypothetical protein